LVTAFLLTMMALGGTAWAQDNARVQNINARLGAQDVVPLGQDINLSLWLDNDNAVEVAIEQVKVTVNGVEVSHISFTPPNLGSNGRANDNWTGMQHYRVGADDLPGPLTFGVTISGRTDPGGEFGVPFTINLTRTVDVASFNYIKRVNGAKETEIDLGDQVQYTFEVTNTGSAPLDDLIIDDPDIGFYYERGEPLVPGGTSRITAPPYTPGAGDFTGGEFVNTATITAVYDRDEFGTPSVMEDTDTATVILRPEGEPQVDLSVRKSVDNATPLEGQEVTFTVTVTNEGSNLARDVRLRDVLPAGLTYVSHSANRGTFDVASGDWQVGSLGVDSSATLNIRATVDAGTAGTTLTNTARLTGSDPADSNPANNEARASVTPQAPDQPEEPEEPEEEPVAEMDQEPEDPPLPRTGGNGALYIIPGLLALGSGLYLRRRAL